MRITAVEKMKIEAFISDIADNNALLAVYAFPYTSVRGKDVISIIGIVDDGLLEDTDKLKEVMSKYKTNVGYKKVLSFSLDSKDNYDINNTYNNLKALASGVIIFDKNGYYKQLKDDLDYEYLNTATLEHKSPIR